MKPCGGPFPANAAVKDEALTERAPLALVRYDPVGQGRWNNEISGLGGNCRWRCCDARWRESRNHKKNPQISRVVRSARRRTELSRPVRWQCGGRRKQCQFHEWFQQRWLERQWAQQRRQEVRHGLHIRT